MYLARVFFPQRAPDVTLRAAAFNARKVLTGVIVPQQWGIRGAATDPKFALAVWILNDDRVHRWGE